MVEDAINEALETFLEQTAQALPNIIAGIIFLVLAYIGIKIFQMGLKSALTHRIDDKSIIALISTIISFVLWYLVALVVMNIVGLGEIAASLGTATGFIALGIAYALSDMLADTVAGYYLIRDADFTIGDRVQIGDTEGEVIEVGLRKSRLRLEDGTTAVLANSEVEKKWFKKSETLP